MDPIQVISQVGFPIAAYLLLVYHTGKRLETLSTQIKSLTETAIALRDIVIICSDCPLRSKIQGDSDENRRDLLNRISGRVSGSGGSDTR